MRRSHIGVGYVDGLRDSTRVWCAEVVHWQCEWRVFVANGVIVGTRRYDGDEEARIDEQSVAEMVALLNATGSAPSGCALDVGLMAGGHTALVELNDGFGIGSWFNGAVKDDSELRDPPHEIEIVETDWGSARWRCSCGQSSGGRWSGSADEALKAAERHVARAFRLSGGPIIRCYAQPRSVWMDTPSSNRSDHTPIRRSAREARFCACGWASATPGRSRCDGVVESADAIRD